MPFLSVVGFFVEVTELLAELETWQRILPVLGQAGGLSKTAVPTIAAKLAKVETTGQPSGDEGLSLLLREVLCQIDPEAVE